MGTGEVEEFEAQRWRLFSLAYRLLGSADEAQDVVQDAFLRWDAVDHAAIAVPSAWLTTVVTNVSLTRLTSARARRERYVGPWLPEPVITSDGALGPLDTVDQRVAGPAAGGGASDPHRTGGLTPTERAVAEIAQILELTPANCRQLQRRATHRLDGHRRFDPDTDALRALVAADVTSWVDGGGRAPAALRPVVGRDRLLRLFAAVPRRFPDARLEQAEVNGWPGLLGWRAHHREQPVLTSRSPTSCSTSRTSTTPRLGGGGADRDARRGGGGPGHAVRGGLARRARTFASRRPRRQRDGATRAAGHMTAGAVRARGRWRRPRDPSPCRRAGGR